MELIFIIGIAVGGLFLLLLLIFVCMYINGKRKYNAKMTELTNMYNDKNSPKMDYDFALYDEEAERMLSNGVIREGQLTIDDVMNSTPIIAPDETVFASVEKESIEEITGSYTPD